MTTQEIFEQRGYVVFGHYEPGQVGKTWESGSMALIDPQEVCEVELRVIAQTTREEWFEQAFLIGIRHLPPWPFYYRVIAE